MPLHHKVYSLFRISLVALLCASFPSAFGADRANPYQFKVEALVAATLVKRGEAVPLEVSFKMPEVPPGLSAVTVRKKVQTLEILLSPSEGDLDQPETLRIRDTRNNLRHRAFRLNASSNLPIKVQFTPLGSFGSGVKAELLINGVRVAQTFWRVIFDSKGRGRETSGRNLIREHRTRIDQGKLPNAGYVIPPTKGGRR